MSKVVAQPVAPAIPATAVDRLARLQVIASALISAPTGAAIGDTLTGTVLAVLGARSGNLARLEGQALRVVACHPHELRELGNFAVMNVEDATPTTDALRSGTPSWLSTGAEFDARYPHLAGARSRFDDQAWAAIPLRVGERMLGVLGLTFGAPQEFDAGERDFFTAVASQCALALERARLLEDEQAARQQLELQKTSLASLLDRVPVPLCILRGEALTYEFANGPYRALRGAVVGRTLLQVFPELEGQPIPELLREVIRTGVRFASARQPATLRTGEALSQRYLNLTCERIAGSGGAPDSVVVASIDVTDEVEAQRALDFERRRWEQTVAQMPSGLVLVDAASSKPAFVNDQAVRIWSHELANQPATGERSEWRAFDLEGREVAPADFPLARALRGETVRDCRMAFELPGLTGRLVTRSNTAPLRDEAGHVIAAVSVFDDVTRDVAAEEERARMVETLRAEAVFRDRLVAILGHDLRDPLAAIMFGADRLLRQHLTEADITKVARRIVASGGRMRRMISELLLHAQARQSGTFPILPAAADLRPLVRETIAELELAFPGRSIDFRGEGDGRGVWDADRLSAVMGNLAGNALQHGDPAQPVEILLEGRAGEPVVLTFRNYGTPIEPAALQTLFEPYRRGVDPTRRPGSLGLGLYIARQIVLAHDGEIEVRSNAEEGTAFIVRLPRESIGQA